MKYSVIDAANDFSSLSNKIYTYKESICKEKSLDIEGNDYRITTLDMIQQFLLSLT
jgi:hypothetical protein